MHPTSLELADCMLSLCDEECPDSTVCDFYSPHFDRLTDEFYAWQDAMNAPIIAAGLEDCSIYDLWSNAEFTYLCVRLGHGVGFADHFMPDSTEYALARIARDEAKRQPYLEDGCYRGDDGTVYIYNYHGAEL